MKVSMLAVVALIGCGDGGQGGDSSTEPSQSGATKTVIDQSQEEVLVEGPFQLFFCQTANDAQWGEIARCENVTADYMLLGGRLCAMSGGCGLETFTGFWFELYTW